MSKKGTVVADMKKLKPDELHFIVRAVLEAVGYRSDCRNDALSGVDFQFIQQGCGPCTRWHRLEKAVREAVVRYRGRFVSPHSVVTPTQSPRSTDDGNHASPRGLVRVREALYAFYDKPLVDEIVGGLENLDALNTNEALVALALARRVEELALQNKARAQALEEERELDDVVASRRSFDLVRRGETNVIRVYFKPIDASNCAYAFVATDGDVAMMLENERKHASARMLTVGPANESGGISELHPGRLSRFRMSKRMLDRVRRMPPVVDMVTFSKLEGVR